MSNENNETNVNETESTTEKSSGINWSKVLVRNTHGMADLDLTMAKLVAEAQEFIAQTEVSPDLIGAAVLSAFDKMPSAQRKTLDMDTLAIRALNEIKVSGVLESKITKSIKDYVRGESDLFKKTLGAEGAVVILTGRDRGGVSLSTEDVVKAYRVSQEKKAKAAAAAK